MFKCASAGAPVDGVTIDLFDSILKAYAKQEKERASVARKAEPAPDSAAAARRPSVTSGLPPSPVKGGRRPFARLLGGSAPAEHDEYANLDMRLTVIASKLIRPLTKDADSSYARMLVKKGVASALAPMPGTAANVGRASVYLAISPYTEFDEAVEAVRLLGKGPTVHYYLDMLCINLWAEGLDHISDDLTEVQNKFDAKITQVSNAAEKAFDTDGVTAIHKRNARLAEKRERRAADARERYYEKDFDDAMFACREAVFVMSLIDEEGGVAPAMFDMQFMYSLWIAASKAGRLQLTLKLVPQQDARLKTLLLDEPARQYFLQQLRTFTFANARPRSNAERTAILDAIGSDADIEAADRVVYDTLRDWLAEFGTAMVDEAAVELGAKKSGKVWNQVVDREDVFKLWRAMLFIDVERGRVDFGLKRSRELVAFAKAGYEDDHPIVVDALNALANCLRRMGGDENQKEAIGIYEDLIVKSGQFALADLVSGTRSERSLGAQMQLANALRDHGDHAQATPNYRAVLQRSEDKLGKDHPNTAYAQMALANNLRIRIDSEAEPTLEELCKELDVEKVPGPAAGGGRGGAKHNAAAVALLHHAQKLYKEAEQTLRAEFKSVHPMTIAARLNAVVLSIDLAEHIPAYKSEANQVLADLYADCLEAYGEKHELTVYVMAKQGELQFRYGETPTDSQKGKHQMLEAKKRYEALKLGDSHPRVQELKARMHMKPGGVSHNPTMSALARGLTMGPMG